ncbi:EAL domain-containing response regulator [Azorhizobium sp. AG788]|uniref:EAL domain-containing response regulator n=1 Tax=Azorhizobium sp. AG788 TaxID=2183897 RepID=UPI003139B73E
MARARGILVLDDEPELREDIAQFLLDAGFFVDTAGNAGELSDAQLTTFDVVLLDIAMPGLDGLDVVRRFSLMPQPPRLLLISGRGEDMLQTVADVARRGQVDVVGVLQKPFDPQDLLDLLRRPPARPRLTTAPQWTNDQILRAVALAVETGTLPLAFQPKVTCDQLAFAGAEALLAGHLPHLGPVSPPDMVDAAASDPHLLREMSLDVVRMAAEGCRRWTDAGWACPVSINLPFEVLRGEQIVATLLATVRAAGIPESSVIFELTEDSIYDSSTEALAVLARLRLAGFGLSLDDVGRRQSGLLQVANLPITEVKIDLEILAQARRWVKSRSIFGSIAELGRRLGLSVVAEGVETRDDLALVRSLPVDYVQGYLVSRKLLLPDLLAMLAACPPHGPLVPVDSAASAP